uniref:hypothetical protein n=1 Tax=Cephaloticoccus sp. TaxID=1985742 RepID=UPI004049CBA2
MTFKCYECHPVDGVPGLPEPTVAAAEVIKLGGEVSKRRTYGELVAAIIHPSLARTVTSVVSNGEELEMPNFNKEMTVAQMLDLVAFVHPRYLRLKPLYYDDYYGP